MFSLNRVSVRVKDFEGAGEEVQKFPLIPDLSGGAGLNYIGVAFLHAVAAGGRPGQGGIDLKKEGQRSITSSKVTEGQVGSEVVGSHLCKPIGDEIDVEPVAKFLIGWEYLLHEDVFRSAI